MSNRRCVVYARISVTQEASVSIERQVEAAQQYAAARSWEVVGVFRDEGVSATSNRPEDRTGWRTLLDSPQKFDAVLVWKIDRLARRVLDFLHADEALQKRGAGIVAVEDPVDMTTAQGRAFAQILAVFGEMEAATIRDRVKDARNYLLRAGRVVGGTLPYGWRSVPNPDGPGFVLAHDEDRIHWVRGMAERAARGDSIYSITQWLDAEGAPLPRASQGTRKRNTWHYGTVERLLRNPVLAGMTAHNPGNTTKTRGTELLRRPDGLPVVDESVAIMSPEDWRALVRQLDDRATPQTRPRAMRTKTSALLSGLLRCANCTTDDGSNVRMHRGNVNAREGYYCPRCHQAISNFEEIVVDEFLKQKGPRHRWSVMREVYEGGAALLPEIENRLDELDSAIREASSREQRQDLQAQQADLLDLRDQKRAEAPRVELRPVRSEQSFGEDWASAASVEDKRAVLDDAITTILVRRGRPGRRTAASVLARLDIAWRTPDIGPYEEPDDATLAAWAADEE